MKTKLLLSVALGVLGTVASASAIAFIPVAVTVTTNIPGIFNPSIGPGVYVYNQTVSGLAPGANVYIPVAGPGAIIPISGNFVGFTNKAGWNSPPNPAYTLNANNNTLFPLLAVFSSSAGVAPVVFHSLLPPTSLPFGFGPSGGAISSYIDPIAPIPEPGSLVALAVAGAAAVSRRRRS